MYVIIFVVERPEYIMDRKDNMRHKVFQTFTNAIDCEERDDNKGAYFSYLEGLSLVSGALKAEGISTKAVMTLKERKSLLSFAKQSVERLQIIVDKLDKLEVDKNLEEILDFSSEDTENENEENNVIQLQTVPPNEARDIKQNNFIDVVENYEPELRSPLVELQHENSVLIARYNARMHLAPSMYERQNLQLELERRLAENTAIATRRQEVWVKNRNKSTARCQQLAQLKFQIDEKLKDGTIQDIDRKKQKVYATSLQYSEDNMQLRNIEEQYMNSPNNITLARSLVNFILNDKKHPLCCLLNQRQSRVLNQLTPLKPKEEDAEILQEGVIAYQTHFKNISDDIKSDINLIETLLKALYDPLNIGKHQNVVTECVHDVYFQPVKHELMFLLRICNRDIEKSLEWHMQSYMEGQNTDALEENKKMRAVLGLKQVVSLHSPCTMLSLLVDVIRSFVTYDQVSLNPLGADDLLPRLVDMITVCGIVHLPSETSFMECFMPSHKALGEEGYCVTLLQSAIICVTSDNNQSL